MKPAFIGYATNQGITVIAHSLAKMFTEHEYLVVPHPGGVKMEKEWLDYHYKIAKQTHPDNEDVIRFFEETKPDVFIAVETPFNPNAFRIARRLGIRSVFYPMVERFPADQPEWRGVANDCDIILCPTKQAYKFFLNYYPDKTKYLPYPIDVDRFEFKRRNDCFTFLHNAGHGGVACRKGTREMVQAFSMIKNKEVNLIINSQKPKEHYGSVLSLIEQDDRIEFRHFNTNDLNCLYRDGDVAVQPSKFEGIGLTVPESMACGLPTITTNAAPMNEFVEDRKYLVDVEARTASLSPNKDTLTNKVSVNHLASIMEGLAGIDISVTSEEVRKKIEEKFSYNSLKEKHRILFESLI
ncbi:MAG: glycosyltransferase [Perlabentimonas sp.]